MSSKLAITETQLRDSLETERHAKRASLAFFAKITDRDEQLVSTQQQLEAANDILAVLQARNESASAEPASRSRQASRANLTQYSTPRRKRAY